MPIGGFFSREEVSSSTRTDGRIRSCVSCGLHKYVLSPRMDPFGKFEKGILCVGEAPGEDEDKKGKQWQGKVGRRLQSEFKRLGINLFEDCLNINAINCRPTDEKGNNREPSPEEILCCRPRVLRLIQERKPGVVIALGNQAISCLIGGRWRGKLGGIMKWRGWCIPDRTFNTWICPVWHPSFVERQGNAETDYIWEQDLKRAISMIHEPFPRFSSEENLIHHLDSPSELTGLPELVSFDYETTGLKPHAEGHQIVCASVAYNENDVKVFLMPGDPKEYRYFTRMLRNPKIGKMAHNMKFEAAWSEVRLQTTVENWVWDSMQAAHILDNRPDTTSLDFQVYVNFGVVSYDSELKPYLKSKDNTAGGNAFNKIDKLLETTYGRDMLLRYNALDSLYEYRLAMKQRAMIGL